jgi:hypothetical protein
MPMVVGQESSISDSSPLPPKESPRVCTGSKTKFPLHSGPAQAPYNSVEGSVPSSLVVSRYHHF